MRCLPPPIPIEELHIDYILLSHTHYDHYDIATAKKIGNRAKWIIPKGVQSILKSIGITNTIELDWWQSYFIDNNNNNNITNNNKTSNNEAAIQIVFTPTQHWSSRSLFDRGSSLWGSYAVLSPQSRFFFTGDTAYCNVFKDIGETYGPFDLAAIPIGAYKPRQFMKDVHCDPTEAILIHQDLKAKQSVAIHWGTFELSEEEFIEPALELGRARKVLGVKEDEIFTMAHGETLSVGSTPKNDLSLLHPHLLEEHSKHYEDELESEEEIESPNTHTTTNTITSPTNINIPISISNKILFSKTGSAIKKNISSSSLYYTSKIMESHQFKNASETFKRMMDPLKKARIIWGSSPKDASV